MSTILLSIKPEYAHKIFNGTKEYEFRKFLPRKPITKIIVYSSSPEKAIIGEMKIVETLSMKPTPLWEQTKKKAGISRKEFRDYFDSCTNAHAFVIGETKLYDIPKSLKEYGISQAPQSFVYLQD